MHRTKRLLTPQSYVDQGPPEVEEAFASFAAAAGKEAPAGRRPPPEETLAPTTGSAARFAVAEGPRSRIGPLPYTLVLAGAPHVVLAWFADERLRDLYVEHLGTLLVDADLERALAGTAYRVETLELTGPWGAVDQVLLERDRPLAYTARGAHAGLLAIALAGKGEVLLRIARAGRDEVGKWGLEHRVEWKQGRLDDRLQPEVLLGFAASEATAQALAAVASDPLPDIEKARRELARRVGFWGVSAAHVPDAWSAVLEGDRIHAVTREPRHAWALALALAEEAARAPGRRFRARTTPLLGSRRRAGLEFTHDPALLDEVPDAVWADDAILLEAAS
jgi:hypothetical protein